MTHRWARRHGSVAIVLLVAIVCGALGATVPASAQDVRVSASFDTIDLAKVTRRGTCSGPSNWRLTLSRESPGTIRIRFQVRGGKPDQRWNVFISDNGDRVFTGSRISGRDGYFVVRTSARDRDGRDKIRAGANNTVTGETCRGGAAI